MHLVINHMTELDHIDDSDCRRLVEPVTCTSIPQICLTISWKTCLVCIFADVIKGGTVEDRRAEFESELCSGPTENCLVNLTEVHT